MDKNFVISVLGMFLVTYVPRFLPVFGLSRVEMPSFIKSFLEYIPVSVLSALLFPTIFLKGNHLFISYKNTFLIASIPTLLVAYKSRKLFSPVIVGIISYILISFAIN